MNQTIKKSKGGASGPSTKLKQLWRGMPEDERDRWRDIFVSNVSSAEIREKIKGELKVELAHDVQLCRFRDWEERERQQEEREEGLEEDKHFWETRFGTRGIPAVARQEMLACSYARALRSGNYQDVLRTMRADNRDRRLDLAVHNSSETYKDNQVRALEFCLDDAGKFPEVKEIFQEAFAALKKAKGY